MKILIIFGLLMAGKITKALEVSTCEPIKSDLCSGKGLYNTTGMPNFADQKQQADAIEQVQTYLPLIQAGCHSQLQFFLCSVYIPLCVPQGPQLVPPCRPLCESVKSSCEPTLKRMGYPWPKVLECSKFPIKNMHKHVCIIPPDNANMDLDLPASSLNALQNNPLFMDKVKEQVYDGNLDQNILKPYKNYVKFLEKDFNKEPAKSANFKCLDYKKSHNYEFDESKKRCIPKCGEDITFNHKDKDMTSSVIVTLAVLCFISSFITTIFFLLNSDKDVISPKSATAFANQSPAFMSLAFVGYSFGYLISQIGIYQNPEWLCVDYDDKTKLAAEEGQRSQPCIVIFLFIYFFGSAATAWWTVINFSWAFTQRFTPKEANMSRVSRLCHIYGWGIPAIFTLASILKHNIQADELTSVCFPGALHDDSSLLSFIIIPEAVHFVFGAIMYLSGCFLAFCCGDATTNERVRGKLEAKALQRLKFRFTIHGLVFIILKVFIFFTWLYEYTNRNTWLRGKSDFLPNINVFWIRIILSLLMGILMPWWILTRKSRQTCMSLWRKSKSPQNPGPTTFQEVSYRPQAIGDHNMVSINDPRLQGQRTDYL